MTIRGKYVGQWLYFLVIYGLRIYLREFSGKGVSNDSGVVDNDIIFCIFAAYFFRNFRDVANIIIQQYAVHRWLVSDPKIHDLEWRWLAISR